jgi:hypothetical protein
MLQGDIESQIKMGADILSKYYRILNHRVDDAVHAYNIGLGNLRRGRHNPQYIAKFKNERRLYA